MDKKILSLQTASGWFSLDYEQEQTNIEDHDERVGDLPGLTPQNAPPIPSANDPANPNQDQNQPANQPPQTPAEPEVDDEDV